MSHEKGLHIESKMSLDKSSVSSPQASIHTDLTIKPGGTGGRNKLSHSSKEDGEITDVQSTGFSIHGAPGSGDSGRGTVSTGNEQDL